LIQVFVEESDGCVQAYTQNGRELPWYAQMVIVLLKGTVDNAVRIGEKALGCDRARTPRLPHES
jgi:hypothetical protein